MYEESVSTGDRLAPEGNNYGFWPTIPVMREKFGQYRGGGGGGAWRGWGKGGGVRVVGGGEEGS